jgi:obg-like ATPase 1
MPPKKQDDKKEQHILWGRPANTLKMGIVGLPNVGKSTTYNVLSNLNVPAENYPFCTIEPNKAVVPVPDDRFIKLCEMFKPKSEMAAVLQVVDIAGIVRGASKGEGLGNHFLSNIRDVDGIYHVIRAFEDEEIAHTENSVDPIRDMEIINTELVLKDLEYVNNRLEDLDKVIKRTNPKEAREEKEILDKVNDLLTKNQWVRHGNWTNNEIGILNTHRFITAKAVVYLVNLSEEDFISKKNKWLKKIKDYIDNNCPGEIIPYSAEHEKTELENKGADKRTMLPKIIKSGYNSLDLIYFFTAGADEVRCWTIRKHTKAPQAAGVIHTDFEKGFICA